MKTKLRGLVTIVHPLPSLAMTITALLLSLPLNENYTIYLFFLFGIIILFENFITGLTNDLLDYRYDVIVKPYKPLVQELITKREAEFLLLVLIIFLSFALLYFDVFIDVLLLSGLCCGLSYDLGLKKTFLSFLPYTLAMPTLLIVARLVNGSLPLILFWIYPFGALMSLVLHLTNQMNKAEESNISGKSNLLHFLGVRNGQYLCVIIIICTTILFTLLSIIYNLNINFTLLIDFVSLFSLFLFILLAKFNKRRALFPICVGLCSIMGLAFVQMTIFI